MTSPQRIVVDTNALVSRLLLPDSIPAQAVSKAVDIAQLLVSESTLVGRRVAGEIGDTHPAGADLGDALVQLDLHA